MYFDGLDFDLSSYGSGGNSLVKDDNSDFTFGDPADTTVYASASLLNIGEPTSYIAPTFLGTNGLVDPTNTSDLGGVQNTSTPKIASRNNPETAGGSSIGGVLNSAINAAFAGWQLASQPQGTPKVVKTQVGTTQVVSGVTGLPSLLSSQAGGSNTVLLVAILAIGALIVYRLTKG